MIFETETKANTFIKFNSDEIARESGYAPVRAYHCLACNAWHLTSSREVKNLPNKTELAIAAFSQAKVQKAEQKVKNSERREAAREKLHIIIQDTLKTIEEIEQLIQANADDDKINKLMAIANENHRLADNIQGATNLKKKIKARLDLLRAITKYKML